ncbi:MAG TPA: sulfite exporter TauE/SafE family protein [Flavobacterium sp.]|nr:sulfite exporter TauE/SafE family protein [Flavobacterium sp.]
MTLVQLIEMPLLLGLLVFVSFLYSSVGHGGASGYLALMSIFSFPISFMKPTALILNILVSGLAFYFYQKENKIQWKTFNPFIITSIPFAFIGGYLKIDTFYFNIILAMVLLVAVLRLLGIFGKEKEVVTSVNIPLALFFGAIIGLLSGLLGIGGGILLTPLLIILGWATFKQAATMSALFILINSISGLLGFVAKGEVIDSGVLVLAIFAFMGGTFGAYYGSKKFNLVVLRNILAFVLSIAIYKLYVTA